MKKIIKKMIPQKMLDFIVYKPYLSDKVYLKKKFKKTLGYELNLDNPQTFNEKLQWLKLNDRNPEYVNMVDKYEAKKYVASIIGEEYIIPTYGVWNSFDEINFADLPTQFVLKTTHDSGGVVICKDKLQFDYKEAKKKINKSLKRNFYLLGREWPYKYVKPRIIAEKYMEDAESEDLKDYKFFCFNGEVKMLYIASDRQSLLDETKFDFYDSDFTFLNFINTHPNSKNTIIKPSNFEKMKQLSKMLSSKIPHLRVDFYEINRKVYFGELTFYHNSGFVPFEPKEWDLKIGEWLKLPNIDQK